MSKTANINIYSQTRETKEFEMKNDEEDFQELQKILVASTVL